MIPQLNVINNFARKERKEEQMTKSIRGVHNVSRLFARPNLYAVPKVYNAFITLVYDNCIDDLPYEYNYTKEIWGKNYPNFVAYGGGKKAVGFGIENKCIYLTDIMTIRHSKIKKGGLHE